ncbi:PREDICTED: guanylate cyclase 32E-like [Priapulus caudatus]|uniref:Guanylate cyclase n=1 Tax=Priapulus caudatus TaxID=37621 RepID=A0ABM1EPU5_PRICU|nr:PREDICTED: guanylate cyclase 32E-like [Priapulus caudatus]
MQLLSKQHDVTILGEETINDIHSTRDDVLIKEIVSRTAFQTRVYVLITNQNDALVDLVIYLAIKDEANEIKFDEYVIIFVEEQRDEYRDKQDQHPHLQKFLEKNEEFDKRFEILPMSVEGFRQVFKITPRPPSNPEFGNFEKSSIEYSSLHFKMDPPPPVFTPSVPIYAAHAYDAVFFYAKALNETIQHNGGNITVAYNGSAIVQRMINATFKSIQGHEVHVNEDGDAQGNYTVMSLKESKSIHSKGATWAMRTIGEFQAVSSATAYQLPVSYVKTEDIDWLNGIPRDEPYCGFDNSQCKYTWQTGVVAGTVLSIIVVVSLFMFRRWQYETKLRSLQWIIDFNDIRVAYDPQGNYADALHTPNTTPKLMPKMGRVRSLTTNSITFDQMGPDGPAGGFPPIDSHFLTKPQIMVGVFRRNPVALKHINKKAVEITRAIRKEHKIMREMRHENIVPCLGACTNPDHIYIVTQYSARGSLEDILNNKDIQLDNMFIASLVQDLIKGMMYLHDSEIISHGNLKSSNCVIDSRWVLQVKDFGLHEFRAGAEELVDQDTYYRRQLWRAPELLRMSHPPARGTQRGDVYSFCIILYEIMGREGPFGRCNMTNKEIAEKVKCGIVQQGNIGLIEEVYRPPTANLNCDRYIVECMRDGWAEDPEMRPDFRFIRIRLRQMQAGLKPNIFDNMLDLMEKYSSNLEVTVQERTQQLIEEKKKTDELLYRMLPKQVAEQLKGGNPVDAEGFDAVTIYFSDIVGFTSLSSASTPMQVVELLNDLYTAFDSILGHYMVYKVETIGDAYMVVSGLPIRNGDNHAGEIASMALHLLRRIRTFKIRHRPNDTMKLRIGIHSGPCVAGVVGHKMPRYCLFGDTVNTSSRMESNGEALKIHISENTKLLLDKIGGYYIKERGLVNMKGKGEMRTYWLLAEDRSRRVSRQHQQGYCNFPQQTSLEGDGVGLNRQSSVSSIDSETGLLDDDHELEKLVEEGVVEAGVGLPCRPPTDPAMIKIKYKNVKSQVDEAAREQRHGARSAERRTQGLQSREKVTRQGFVNRLRGYRIDESGGQAAASFCNTQAVVNAVDVAGRSDQRTTAAAVWVKQTREEQCHSSNSTRVPDPETNEEFVV